MMNIVIDNMYYIASLILFLIGLHTILAHSNIIKKIMGINIMETSIFLFFVSIGYIKGGSAPILLEDGQNAGFVNPIPTALILTGIVVAVSVTAYALSLAIKLYRFYGTLNAREISMMRNEGKNDGK
jgi:multicomponent Na+:H+ antiporter subunit C